MVKTHVFLHSGGMFLTAVLIGCTTGAVEREGMECGADYRCVRDMVAQYRQQAAELQAMADQYAADAASRSRQSGQESEQAKRSGDLAKQMWTQAQEADQHAREYQSQLPHGIVY